MDSDVDNITCLNMTTVQGVKSAVAGMDFTLQAMWVLLFSGMLFIAISGNTMVIWSVIAHRRMRTVTNYFLVNLSLSDLVMSIFNCIFNFISMMNNDWTFGTRYCTINNYLANVSVAASVFTLTGITIDRHLAIIKPLKPRMSKASAQLIIGGIWALSFLIGSPCLVYSTTITHKASGLTACILQWPDGYSGVSTLDYIYNLIFFLVTYLIPIAAMICCYTTMGRELWGSKTIGELTQRQIDSIRSKRKVVRMFILIVLVFGLCWLPYHSYFIYVHHRRDLVYSKYIQHVYLGFYWLAMANAMLNPLIYYCMNQRFRDYFRMAICEWDCRLGLCDDPLQADGGETPPPIKRCSHSYSRSGGTRLCQLALSQADCRDTKLYENAVSQMPLMRNSPIWNKWT
ncbi:tachykinin-like peptides receptor 86C [Cimex lectularius]|uniref:G-protein coupled receptors family 1 profile domain-containing protein n=1 Tax=Cimex lectularius TaxID=79782 RepID=A0A8I6SPM3_CIMLE|nr:tachykinin-like peptides receptor 86C [Cimex lectularius]